MKKIIDEFKTTTDRTIYVRCKRRIEKVGCFICAPGRGCNRRNRSIDNSWKRHRKTRYRN